MPAFFSLLAAATALAGSPDRLRGLYVAGAADDQRSLYQRKVALVVGIDVFEDDQLTLRNAVRDAQSIAAVLEEGYGFDEVITLYNDDASREGVDAALESLQALEPEDALLIFWAGHGTNALTVDGTQQGYLVPWDGSLDPADEANISMGALREQVERAIPARHKFLIVDACYSGLLALRGSAVVRPHDSAYLKAIVQQPVFQILTAGDADQAVLDDGPGGHSVFTGRLLESLESTGDFITATELSVTLQRQVRQDAYDRSFHEQSPVFGKLSGTGDFILIPTETDLDLSTIREPWLTPLGQRRLPIATGALAIGAAGMATAAVTADSYRNAPLSAGQQPALFRTNLAANAVGVSGLLTGAAFIGATIKAEW